MIRNPLFLCFLLASLSLFGQSKYTISGYITDSLSGEDLIGANVIVDGDASSGATANVYGFYSITLPEGTYSLTATYVGYASKKFKIKLANDQRLNIKLQNTMTQLQEVTVTAEKKDENVSSTEISTTTLNIEEIKSIPALMGEVDIMKTLQLLPGVQSAGEGNAGLYVRGGGPDQNLVLLDEAIVYNPGHLFGFFSVFNSDAIKNTTLMKGGMPANYGGRLSSVVDVSMKDGNNQKFQASGGVGLISSRLTVEGPLVKDRSSFMVSGRRTYADALIAPFTKGTDLEGNAYYFYDLNAKANYRFSDKDRIYVSGYFGRDVFSFTGSSGDFKIDIPWGNATMTARWNHLFSDKLFMNASVIYNSYDFATKGEQQDFAFEFNSEIEDFNGKLSFDYYPHENWRFKFGLDYINHTLSPLTASLNPSADSVDITTDRVEPKYAHEGAVFAALETDITDQLRLNAGLRWSGFQQVGPYRYFGEDSAGDITDTIQYARGEPIAFYQGAEPRISLRYLLNEKSSLKAAFTINRQYVHLVTNSNTTLPTDIWVPSSKLVEPQIAYQYSAGYFRNFKDNMYETSVEVYYKDLRNQIEFEDGYRAGLNQEVERSFVFGKGYSYGVELFIKKRYGKLNGWIGYTWSKTDRQFPDINNGKVFPAKYDRRHDLSVVATYELSDRWAFSGTFVYGTGNAFTMPESWFLIDGNVVAQYGDRNSFRLADYHRMDISAVLKGKPNKKFYSEWVFSVYNVYSRLNPYFIYFENEGGINQGDFDLRAKQVSLFPIIPSITWNFKWK